MPVNQPPQNPQPPQTNPVQNFFSNPANLAASLVFLAALAQPKQQGQSDLGAFAQRAVGGVALRGAIDNQTQQRQTAERELQRKNLAASRALELEAQRNQIAQSGVDVNRAEIKSREQIERDREANALKIQQTPQAITPEQADLLKSEATRNRAQAGALGAKDASNDPLAKMREELAKQLFAGEVQQAQLEGRPPDITRILEPLVNFDTVLRSLPPGAKLSRDAQGNLGVDLGTGENPQPGQPIIPPPPSATPPAPAPITLTEAVTAQRQSNRAKALSRTTAQPTADEQQATEELKGLTSQQIAETLQNQRDKLTAKQVKQLRMELYNRRHPANVPPIATSPF